MKKSGFAFLRIIHLALLAGQVLFSGVVFYLVYAKIMLPSLQEQDKTFQLSAIAIAVIAYYSGNYLFKRKMLQLKENVNTTISEKFVQYRTTCLIQWALLEAATLFCGISFLLVGNYAFLALGGVLILWFALLAPNKTKIALQLGIGLDEANEL